MLNVKFGKLTVIDELPERTADRRIQYKCLCDCGNEHIITGRQLKKGTKSCGCIQKEAIGSLNRKTDKFNISQHPLYSRWLGMKQRCGNPRHHKYKDYGGRGITVCEEWKDSFLTFLADMGECPKGCSIDRIDNNKGYMKDNCKWSTNAQQCQNRRKKNSGKMY